MPDSTKQLFTYDPAKAKQMLAAAGYPDGFSMEMTYAPSDTPNQAPDIASMIVDMWGKIGVKVTLKPVEAAVLTNLTYGHTYTDGLLTSRAYMTAGVSMAMGVKGHEENSSAWDNAQYTSDYDKAFAERDPSKSLALKKEMVLRLLDAATMMATPVHSLNAYAWPWVKNYYGEISAGFMNFNPMLKFMWIDQGSEDEDGILKWWQKGGQETVPPCHFLRTGFHALVQPRRFFVYRHLHDISSAAGVQSVKTQAHILFAWNALPGREDVVCATI